LPDDALNIALGEGNNSIAVIVRHLGGNLISRYTEFLTSDGEKPWRNRDAEFEQRAYTRDEMMEWWNNGWSVVLAELQKLSDADLSRSVTIRNQSLRVHEALTRSLSHTSYHVGQIVLLGRIALGDKWQTLTIARGKSAEYNQNPTSEKGPK
jgi:uncharacterized damage-inducible protein DinB